MPFADFDDILGLDWLTGYEAIIECAKRRITLTTPIGRVRFHGTTLLPCPHFLDNPQYTDCVVAGLITSESGEESSISIPVVQYYMDVFPDDLLGLPPRREIDFVIEVYPGTNPISIPPYRMTLAELKELDTQLTAPSRIAEDANLE
ncbi:uncharacterized protein LOC119985514 [Tripterygium wilfordii]|uniref:uncharacterized protein LOC119985514 n=1 Tax=Tripterygium wilfordii TaxID=458696 RepID=UPI0018F852FD|nr:uncharacterized protein LOC119985514 [Tripterygium wilfordii]